VTPPRSGGRSGPGCRALVAGFGRPGMRDLDFGRQVVDLLQQLEWPDGVVVEDLSCAAPIVLHRLQELRPAKVVLLGAVARELEPPATLRRYRLDPQPAGPEQLDLHVAGSPEGLGDLDHTLAMARQWGGLPADTVVIEVEPAEIAFGMGFSEDLAACLDPILDMVREELADVAGAAGSLPDLDPSDLEPRAPEGEPGARAPSDAVSELLGYADAHRQARSQIARPPLPVEGVALAGLVRPWGVCVETGGDWFDTVPLAGGRLGIVVGDVAGRGVEVAAAMSDLRAAARAYAVLDGTAPARLLDHLDRLAGATGLGRDARLVYLVLDPATGEARFASAGGCPPLVDGRFVDTGRSAPLGAAGGETRPEGTLRLTSQSTLLLFTDGLVENRTMGRVAGLERLRRAVADGPEPLDDLCEHVLQACTGDLRRDDDICLLGVRLQPVGAAAVR
jgi:hydrogenase maturation protease